MDIIQEHFSPNGLVVKCLEFAFHQEHIMDFTRMRALESLFSMVHQGIRNVLQYNQQHPDFPMEVKSLFGFSKARASIDNVKPTRFKKCESSVGFSWEGRNRSI